MKVTVVILFMSVLLLQPVMAQLSAESVVSMMYDDNINNNALQLKDNITSLTGNLQYDWEGEQWNGNVSYNGMINYYQKYVDRTSLSHFINGEYYYLSGNDPENVLRIASSLGKSAFHSGYSFYDHNVFSVSADYKQFLSASVINKFGYTYRSSSFVQSPGFSYYEHLFYGHLAFALPTNTTIITQADYGMKYYSEELVLSPSGEGTSSSAGPDVSQVTGMVRIGQRLNDVTGLSASVRYQWNLQKQSRYLIDDEGYMLSDDELFDDHYGYEGLHTSLSVTHIISETMLLKATGGYFNKIYSLLPAYNEDGIMSADRRTDGRFYCNILFEKNFVDLGFIVRSSVDLISQSSNDPYYEYRNKAVSLEVSFPF